MAVLPEAMPQASPETRFPGFAARSVATPRGDVRVRTGGAGPPLLLLHGFPQTGVMWWPVAARLADEFSVVVADLPGYGASFRPEAGAYGKRALAADLVAAMAALGHDAYAVVGHDRGGRVAYRMALDHPAVVRRLAVLDIVPTGAVWARADARFALGYWHWGFLAQAAPLPERMILGAPDVFWPAIERMGIKAGDPRYPDDVVAVYRASLRDPGSVAAMCEDYRAGATVDRELDDAGGTIDCPVLSLWGGAGALPFFYDDPLEPWRAFAPQVTGGPVAGASHFLVEDEPAAVLDALRAFLV